LPNNESIRDSAASQHDTRQLKAEGWVIEDADLARLSPLIWRHINFLGRYNFAVPEVVANGGLRPLCAPGSEEDF
jgi:hypothetical protein